MASPKSLSPLAAQRSYLADLDKEEVAYAEAWWTNRRPNRRFSSGKKSPLRGSFSSEDVPSLEESSRITSPASSIPATPAEYVQEYFDDAQKNREKYYKAWSTAVEKRILGVHEPRAPAIKLNSATRNSNLLAAQLSASADQQAAEDSYCETWSAASIGRTLSVHEPRDPAIKIASTSANSSTLATQLNLHAKRYEQEEAYNEAWIRLAYLQYSLYVQHRTSNIFSSSPDNLPNQPETQPYPLAVQKYIAERRQQEEEYDQAWCDAVKNNLILGSGTRASATKIGSQTSRTNTLAAQLQAAKDQDVAEQAYADAWSRDAAKTPGFAAKASRPSATKIGAGKFESNPFASQLAVFQDEHGREEEYDEAWTAYSNRHSSMAPPPVLRSPRRRSTNSRRLSVSRSPRPAFTRRLPVDVAVPELPMIGFSAVELIPENDGYIKSWRQDENYDDYACELYVAFSPGPEEETGSCLATAKEEEGPFHVARGLDGGRETRHDNSGKPSALPQVLPSTRLPISAAHAPSNSNLLGKIVSFEFVGQSEFTISPDQASSETPMQVTRHAQFKCQDNIVCKIKAAVSITSPEPARRYARNPLPLFDALRSFGHAAMIQLDEVGLGKINAETGKQSIWRRYSVVSGAFRCEVTEKFVDRRMFSPEGCDIGKRVMIKNGLIMSPDGVDYMALPL
ncbi:hypothetical protein FRC10_010097 [Ceratobasidium sp. 414]|nr:hypothetical protein FRC10_010097 [Ceratobasidium sp. 414]